MATPVVSGAAALLLQKSPSLTPDQVKARLMKTAVKAFSPVYTTGVDSITSMLFNGQSDMFTAGAGYLDIRAALSNGDLATKAALSPLAVYDPVTRTVSIVRDFSVRWGIRWFGAIRRKTDSA